MFDISQTEWMAVELSLRVGVVATLVATPIAIALAWALARHEFWGKSIIDAAIHLPLVLPPVVTGYLLLLTFGKRGLVGAWLYDHLGIVFAFRWTGAALACGVMSFPLLVRPIDEQMNLFEFFVHHEDVRRVNGGEPRDLPTEMEEVMWDRLRRSLRLSLRRLRGTQVEVVAEHGGRAVVGGSGPTVRILGPVGELVLYMFNRKDIAQVELSGDAEAVRRYRTFLSAGGSKYPIDLLKDAGVDMTTDEPLDLTIREMDRVMDEMEGLLAARR